MIELLQAYKDYINLLHLELNEVVIVVSNHGWKSQRIEKGKKLRNKIKQLEDELLDELLKVIK